jgi:heme/copper-type cytochrome/quinol oxidase subunit 2
MIATIFVLILLYFAIGFIIVALYGFHYDCDMIFSPANTEDENNKLILIWTFWPFYIIYIIIKAIVYYFKHLYIAIRDISKKYIKFK